MAQAETQMDITDLARQTQALFKLSGAATPQLEQYWNMQGSMLKDAETFARHWFKRRHEATETAVEALHEVSATGRPDPAAAMQAIFNWQRGSAERLNADLQDWTTLCAHLTQAATTAQAEAASSEADQDKATKVGARSTTSGSKSEHATPV